MQVKKSQLTDTEVKLTVVADQKAMESIKEHVLGHFQHRVNLPGFRKGKAPLNLVEKNVDPNLLQTEFLEEAIGQLYSRAIQEEKLRPVGQPEITIGKFVPFQTLEFDAKVPVVGEIKLADYKKIKLKKDTVTVSDKDVDEVVDSLRTRVAEHTDVDRAAKDGDRVWIDFTGKDAKGNPINGAEGKDYPLTLGSNTFIPGFEPELVGLSAGEEKTFTIPFPKDYGVKALAGKKVTFTVGATKVQEVTLPKADDAFAATVGPFKSLAELKADIKKQLEHERSQENERNYESELVRMIAAKSTVAVPKVLVDEQIERIEQDEKQNLIYRGQTWQEHLDEEGVTAEEHKEQKRPAAEERVKASLVLAEVAEQEKLDVSLEELEVRLQILKQQYKDEAMRAELDKPENRREIASRILTEKTLAKLVSYANTK